MAEVVFHPEARDEYEQAIAWHQERSPSAAARFEAAIERTLNLIAENARLFRSYDERHQVAVLRRFPYSLVYRVRSEQVIEVAVAHAKRRPGYWHGRL